MTVERDDYEEKRCLLSTTDPEDKAGNAERIPIRHVIDKLDRALARGDYGEGIRLLDYWIGEARALGDFDGELSVESEMMGLSRRTNDRERGLAAVARGLELRRVKLGMGELMMLDLRQLYEIGMAVIKDDPKVLLCDDPDCLFCRQYR